MMASIDVYLNADLIANKHGLMHDVFQAYVAALDPDARQMIDTPLNLIITDPAGDTEVQVRIFWGLADFPGREQRVCDAVMQTMMTTRNIGRACVSVFVMRVPITHAKSWRR